MMYMTTLFSPMKIKNLEIKNRIVMAPMCQYSSDEGGKVKDWHLIHYSTRAIGGVGLILVEATAVEPRGRISAEDLGIWADHHIEGLRELVSRCKSHGASIGIQLAHAGRKCSISSEKIVAPSAIPFNDDYQTPLPLSQEEIHGVVVAFQEAARRAFEAGFDIIEIHAAHGYLINEFLSPLTNQRTDDYGGSLENRVRFLKEILEAVRRVWPKNLPLIVRVSAEDYAEGGNHPQDIAAMLSMLQEFEIDLINVSSGAVVPAKIDVYPGYQIKYAEIIKERTGIPTIAGGLITSVDMANEIIQNHRADIIFLGRELLRNPYWPLQAAKALGINIQWPIQYERSK